MSNTHNRVTTFRELPDVAFSSRGSRRINGGEGRRPLLANPVGSGPRSTVQVKGRLPVSKVAGRRLAVTGRTVSPLRICGRGAPTITRAMRGSTSDKTPHREEALKARVKGERPAGVIRQLGSVSSCWSRFKSGAGHARRTEPTGMSGLAVTAIGHSTPPVKREPRDLRS